MERDRRTEHLILLGHAISSIGDGIWFAIWAVYLTEVAGIATATMGIVVGAAGLLGIALAYPSGVAADRYAARDVLFGITVLRGLAMIGFCFVEDWVGLLAAALAFFGTQSAATGVRTALVCALVEETRQLDVLARIRVVQHVGYAAGAALGGFVLSVGEAWAFMMALAFNALTFFALALTTALLPRDAPSRDYAAAPDIAVLKDYSYAAVMAVTAAMALCWALMSTALPLWIRGYTAAPPWLSALLLGFSALLIAACQVSVTRRTVGIEQGARAGSWAGALLAASCVLFAMSGRGGAAFATALLVLGSLFVVAGELYFVGSRWALSIGLMDASAKGRYQGVAAAVEAMVLAVGPAVMSIVVTLPNMSGWLLLAVLFAGVGGATPALARWAHRHRPGAIRSIVQEASLRPRNGIPRRTRRP